MGVAQITRERIENFNDGSGVSCRFVKLDESRGIKFYTDPETRDEVMSRQKMGAMFGLAPKVYEVVDLPNLRYYGFAVEVVKVAKYNMPEKFREVKARKETNWATGEQRDFWYGNDAYDRARDELLDKVYDKVGFQMFDGHVNNIGFADDGRMVVIDWGTESVADQRSGEYSDSEGSDSWGSSEGSESSENLTGCQCSWCKADRNKT